MARTIPATTTVPVSSVFARRPVVSDESGPKAARDAAMAHYERGSCEGVGDYYAGGLIDDTAHTAEWRCPLRPIDELTKVWVIGVRGESAAGCTVTATVVDPSADSVDLAFGAGRVESDGIVIGEVDIDHAADYATIRIEFKAGTFTAGSKVTEITAYPKRALATAAALDGLSSTNGVTALDERFGDGMPLSVQRHDDLCTMLEDGYGRAAAGVLTVARQSGDLSLDKGARSHRIVAEVPQTESGRPVELAIHYRVQGTLRVTCDATSVDLPSSPSAWATGSLLVTGAPDGTTRPALRTITFERVGTGIATVRWLSAWWTGVDASDAPQGDAYEPQEILVDESADPIVDEFGEYIYL